MRFKIILTIIVLICVSIANGQLYQKVFFKNVKNSLNENSEKLLNFPLTEDFQSRSYDNIKCLQQFTGFVEAVGNGSFWALQVADSWGKIPSGILQGNFYELGNYDQCLKIDHDTGTVNIGTFQGQYCLASLGVKLNNDQNKPLQHRFPFIEGLPEEFSTRMSPEAGGLGLNIGLCIPNTCSPLFISKIISSAIQSQLNLPVAVILSEDKCYDSTYKELNGIEIFAIVFFSFIGLLLVSSTIYDVTMTQMNRPRKNWLIAFSVYSNGEKIFKCNQNQSANMMECVNGIRVLSITWVVFAHSYVTYMISPITNIVVIGEWLKNPYSMLLMSGTVSVDSFFLLSGLLVAWSMFRHLDKNKGRINIAMLYFHRYLRLTPALAAAMLFYVGVLKRIVDGPVSTTVSNDQSCDNYWWSTLLYVQNYVNPNQMCIGHSWYLSVDMQLFILSPLIVWPMWRLKSKFVWVIPVIIILSMQCVFAVIILNKAPELQMQKVYFPTHTRIGAWLIGILLGYFMHNFKQFKVQKIPLPVLLTGWTISLGSILAIIFAVYPMHQITHATLLLETAFYESFSRVSWAISLAWIIFACVNGYGGPINWFLSLTFWQPLSRLSYCLYIVHMIIQLTIAAMVKTPAAFSDMNAIHKFWGDFGLSLTAALIWTLAFESPVLILEKILLGPKSSTNKPKDELNGSTIPNSNGTENQPKV